ncbi:MAG: DUF1501 domain-containing protein [Rhizobiaceae bacterium]
MNRSKRLFPGDERLCQPVPLTRRRLLGHSAAAAATAAAAMMPTTATSALASLSGSRDPRLLVVVLRGALDGLAAVPPMGDPHYADLRGEFNLTADAVLPLDNLFALNANMPNLAQLYRQKDAAIVHAAATSYRSRSHFDGQDILESGLPRAGGDSGWLNRATLNLASSSRVKPPQGVAIGHAPPLIMQGEAPVLTWSPQFYPHPDADTLGRILALYDDQDSGLAEVLRAGISADASDTGERLNLQSANKLFLREIDKTIAFFSDPDGPRIAALSSDGWDTHAGQNPVKGKLANKLSVLDKGIARMAKGLEPIWQDTVIAIVTEFGRTAAINGTAGTDHGTGTCAFLLGGAVKGGQVFADWPGLAPKALHEGRDLAPTTHINGVFKGILRDHFGLEAKALDGSIFPGSDTVSPLNGLVG